MTATDELRALLDERGEVWGANDTHRLLVTAWNDASGHSWAFMEHRDGSFSKLTAYHLAPAQAIEATLGRGECHIDDGECDQCGALVREKPVTYWVSTGEGMRTAERHNALFCPACGRRVVSHD